MASEQPTANAEGPNEADLAEAFQELAKGERAATALEDKLNEMEAKIEELLAQAERQQEDARKIEDGGASTNGDATSR